MRKNFAKELDDYMALINMRLIDISNDIQELSIVLGNLGEELTKISSKMKGSK